MSYAKKFIKEHSSECIITLINERRTAILNKNLTAISRDYEKSILELNIGVNSINHLIKSNRGGKNGMHGFIGERAQVYLTNSMTLVRGEGAHYSLIDDNGPTDYLRDNTMIQQKACLAGGNFGLNQIETHANHYSFFVNSGGIYQIPKDFYERCLDLSCTPEEKARMFLKEEYRKWLNVQSFNQNNKDIVIEPMNFRYDEIQVNTIDNTIQRVKSENKNVYLSRKNDALYKYRPTFNECLKASSVSALIEGIMNGCICLYDKLKEKNISDMSTEDVNDITLSTIKGVGIGAMRSSTIYIITNTTKISAPTASAAISATCNIAKETKKVANGTITNEKYAENIAWACTDFAVSILAGKFGTKYLSKLLPGKYRFLAPVLSNLIVIPSYNIAKNSIKSMYEDGNSNEQKENIKK